MSDPVAVTVEDTTMAVLTFGNGASGTWVSTNVAPGDGMRHCAIYGSEGSLVWGKGLKNRREEVAMPDLVKAHQASLSEEQKEKFFPGGVQHSCGSELWEFVQAVQGKSSLETGGVEGLKSLAVCMAVYESARLGQAVEIAKVENLEIENYQRDLNQAGGLA
jgi:predicted dehydrogenase